MINKLFNTITVTILILLSIGIAGTFLSDYLTSIEWFGDYEKEHKFWHSNNTYIEDHWGARHYWYNWGCFFLFLTALCRGVVKVVNIIDNDK